MAESSEKAASLSGTRRLADAVRAAKIAAAQRSDVVVDIREADRARLEILAEELKPVAEELSADDMFDLVLSGGPTTRYWIDGTAHVTMARDRRTYRLVRETRLGRVTLAESTEPRKIADHVTGYVAERIVERDKAFAVDDGYGGGAKARTSSADPKAARPLTNEDGAGEPATDRGNSRFVVGFVWFLLGIVVGAGVPLLLSYAYLV